MKLLFRVWGWLINDGQLKDDDFQRLMFYVVIIFGGLFIASVSTVLVSSLHSIVAPSCP